jgi:hypothetical protein
MPLTAQELYTSILYRAADIYDVETDDVERDIGQNFDPIVRFMAGAMASELEQVYHEIDGTERRLQEKLAQVLLPEHFHLPEPAHGLAKAFPKSDTFVIDETTQFQTKGDEDEERFHFSPVFPSRLINAKIEVVATDHQLIDIGKRVRAKRGAKETVEIQRIAIGFSAPLAIENWQGCSLFFDLGGLEATEAERTLFFSALGEAQYAFHGNALSHFKGTGRGDVTIEDYLNGNQRLEASIRSRYDHHFVTFSTEDCPEAKAQTADVFLERWFSYLEDEPEETLSKSRKAFEKSNSAPLFWLEIHFNQPITLTDFKSRLRMDFNVFPVVNRKLCGQGNDEHFWLQTNAVKWIPLKIEDQFLGIRSVYEEKPPENISYIFKPFAGFREEKLPSYTLRFGGIGRWDEYNTWKRLLYIVNVLRQNFKQNEVIEAAASSLSIEEVHQLLGKKIDKSASTKDPQKSIYVLLQSGTQSGVRVRVEHWTSKGEEANGINAKTSLVCVSKHRTSLEKDELYLATPISGGRDALNSTERLDAMKSTLLSRGRLVTREDVKVYCKTFLRDKLASVEIQDGVGSVPGTSYGMTRILEVVLHPSKSGSKADWDGLCRQLQVMITKLSSAHIPNKVMARQTMKTNG